MDFNLVTEIFYLPELLLWFIVTVSDIAGDIHIFYLPQINTALP